MTRTNIGFTFFCVLLGSLWLVYAAFPGTSPPLLGQALASAVLAGLAGVVSLPGGKPLPGRWLAIAAWGAALFALPGVVLFGAGVELNAFTGTLVFTLVPVVVAIVDTQAERGFGMESPAWERMLPAVAAVAGAMMLLPPTIPQSTAGRLWLAGVAVSVVLAGVAITRLSRLLEGCSPAQATLLCAMASAPLQLAGWLALHRAEPTWLPVELWTDTARALLVLLLTLPLGLWLLGRMPAQLFATRFLLAPLVTLLEGFVLVRPDLTWTIAGGMALLAGGSLVLLHADSRDAAAQ